MLDNDMQTPTITLNSLLRASRSTETPIRTKTSKPSEYTPPSRAQSKFLPSSARPLVVFGVIVALNPNPAFVLVLAALVPRYLERAKESAGFKEEPTEVPTAVVVAAACGEQGIGR